jgi:cytochrome d ubiquinol oxidase subunit II
MIASIGPFWDANETWLVLGVGILLIAFPKAHGMVLGALYLPVALMLVGLILRGVAFDFRVKAQAAHKPLWNRAFFAGSGSPRCAGLDARALHHRLAGRLDLHAVRRGHCAAAAGGLCAAGRRLADHEDRRRTAAPRREVGQAGLAAGGAGHGPDLAGHAAGQLTVREQVVQHAEFIALLPIPLMTLAALWALRAMLNSRACWASCAGCPLALMVAVFLLGASAWPTACIPTW